MSTATMGVRVFTFPSGATVDLPAGMTVCASAGAGVTDDVSRYAVAGVTPAGRQVWSHFSCAAYTRAAHVYGMRAAVAKLRARVDHLERSGRAIKAANLRRHADAQEAQHGAAVADWAADPAPCTCPDQA